jgi:DNA-binding CsgD family transcriptional regulator
MKIVARIINTDGLTRKEAEVLRYLCQGLMRSEIAEQLHRTHSTVSRHIESIAGKWDAHSAAEIVAMAVAKGLVDIRIQHTVIKCLLLAVLIVPQHIDCRQPPRHSRHPVQLVRARAAAIGGRSWA